MVCNIVQITHWDLSNSRCLRFIDDAHPAGFGVLSVKVYDPNCKLYMVKGHCVYNLQFTDDPNFVLFINTGGNMFSIKFK